MYNNECQTLQCSTKKTLKFFYTSGDKYLEEKLWIMVSENSRESMHVHACPRTKKTSSVNIELLK